MRLHRLTIEGIGPFPGREEVDFDFLSDAGLFLLTGPTGSGKTSVLDAVCFALFGKLPGQRTPKEISSDYRELDQPCRVELELAVGGEELRVLRSPEHERLKRGGGTTSQHHSARLDLKTGGQWQEIATKPTEVSALIEEKLGMNAEQFSQVVLLPQGGFARFLGANSAERRELLERLFQAQRFSSIEQYLKNEARRASALSQDALQEIDKQIRATAATAGLETAVVEDEGAGEEGRAEQQPDSGSDGEPEAEPVAALPEASEPDSVGSWLERSTAELRGQAEQALQAQSAAVAARSEAETKLAAAKLSGELHRRQSQAEAALQALAAEADEIDVKRTKLAAHQKALPVAQLRRSLVGSRRELHTLAESLEKAKKWAAALEAPDFSDSPMSWAAASSARKNFIENLGDVEQIQQRSQQLSQQAQQAADAGAKQVQTAAQAEAKASELAASLPALEQKIGALTTLAATAQQREEQLQQAQKRLDAAAQRDLAVIELGKAQEGYKQAIDAHAATVKRRLDLHEKRLKNMAFELAEQLSSGEACSVCGSTEHPAPAHAQAEQLVTEQEQAQAEQAESNALATRESQQKICGELESKLGSLKAICGELTVAECEQQLAQARQGAQESAAARQELDQASQALAAARQQQQAHAKSAADATAAAAELETKRQTLLVELKNSQQTLDSALQRAQSSFGVEPGDLVSVRRVLDTQQRGLERAAAIAQQHEQDAAALAANENQLKSLLSANGFSSETEAKGALLPEEQAEAFAADVKSHEESKASASATLAEPEIAALAGQPAPELQPLIDAHQLAQQRADAASTAAAKASTQLSELTSRGEQIAAALTQAAPLIEASRRASVLASMAQGEQPNSRRLSLSAYVLAAQFQEITEAANGHLLRMSSGRYELLAHEEQTSGRGRAGLGLRVRDSHSGSDRDPKSLSGGETFFVSLALALGLAETVTAQAGGNQLATLFIDEGFGSLDEDILEQVMAVLDTLRDGGRAVGIVSHVSELKQRIPTQLQITASPSGSTLKIGSPEAA